MAWRMAGAARRRARAADGPGGGRVRGAVPSPPSDVPRQTFPHQTFLKVPVAQRAPPDAGPPPFR